MFLCVTAALGFQGKAEAIPSNRSGGLQIVVTAVPFSVRSPVPQPFVFPACTSHGTSSPVLGVSLQRCYHYLSNSSHVPIHLSGIDLKRSEVTSGRHLSCLEGIAIPSGLFWHVRARQKCSMLLHNCSDVSGALCSPLS